MTNPDRDNAGEADLVLAYAIHAAIHAIDAPVRPWDELSAADRARWVAVARTAVLALDELPASLAADTARARRPPRTALFDLLQCALAYVANTVSLHADLSAALHAERCYRCPCGACHFEGDAQCECRGCRAHERQP